MDAYPRRLPGSRMWWAFIAFLGACTAGLPVLLVVEVAADPHTAGDALGTLGAALMWLVPGALMLRVGIRGIRAEVLIEPEAVTVRNTFKTYRLPLDKVSAFEAAPPLDADPHIPAQAVLHLRNGRKLALSAFRSEGLATRGAARKRHEDLSAHLAALNEHLATLQAR